ncbi:MAG: CHAT domain-containing protein [Bacteroidetes bacterium]|nr:CHAT domain-containing protein [Bacteroidota bacterium]
MKKIVCIFFILSLIIHHSSFSQTWQHYDSLRSVYQQQQKFDTAILYAEKALQAVKENTGENDTLYARMLLRLMEVNGYSGNYAKAIECCQKEIEIRKNIQGVKHPDYANAIGNLAELYRETGNYSSAEPLFLEAKSIYKEVRGEKHPDYAQSLNYLGLLYDGMGNYQQAELLLLEAMKIRKEVLGENNFDYAQSLGNLAGVYMAMGNYPAAEPLLLEAAKILKAVLGEKHPYYALSLSNLGNLYHYVGNYAAAEPLLIETKNIVKEVLGEKHSYYALSLNNLASLYNDMGNYAAAEPLLIEAKNIYKEVLGEKHPDYATSLNSLAELYRSIGNYPAAKPLYMEEIKIQKEVLGQKHPDYLISLNNLACLYSNMGNYPAAEPLFLEVMNTRKEVLGEKHPFYATTLINLAILYGDMDNNNSAESFYLEGIEKINNNINQNFAFLSEKEKEMYFKTKAVNFTGFYSFALKRKKENPEITGSVYNNVVRNKGLLLKSSTAMRTAILFSKDSTLINKFNQWIALKKEISNLYSTEISKRKENPEELEQQANRIEKELVRSSQVFSDFKQLQNLTWEAVQTSLKQGEAAVEFIRFAEGKKKDTTIYCALIITPQCRQPEMIRLFYEKELESVMGTNPVNNLSYVNSIYGTRLNTSKLLYNLIWQPLEKHLEGVKTVYYSPDGLLHKISLSSIGKGKDIFLCDMYDLHRLSSTGKLAMPENFNMGKGLTAGIYGGIDYSTDSSSVNIWPYLPGTKGETDEIEKIFKKRGITTIYFSGKDAGEKEFKATAAECNLLHVATHGFFYPEPAEFKFNVKQNEASETQLASPRGTSGFGVWQFVMNKNPLMRSGLVFAGANNVWNQKFAGDGEDGMLTALEVTQLDLRKTQLVVLSACETGLGDIKGSEGVYGLQRAFKMAGVNYIIMSLWQVPDKETSEFMKLFYRDLLITKDVRKSFNNIQYRMRKKYDPYSWAAFVLIE